MPDDHPIMIGVTSDEIPNLILGPGETFNAGSFPLLPPKVAILFRPLADASRRVSDVRFVDEERDADSLIAGLEMCVPQALDAVVRRLRVLLPEPWTENVCDRVGRAVDKMARHRPLRSVPPLPNYVTVRCPSLANAVRPETVFETEVWRVARPAVREKALQTAPPDVLGRAMESPDVLDFVQTLAPGIQFQLYLRGGEKFRRRLVDLVASDPTLFDHVPSVMVLQPHFWDIARPADREKALLSSAGAVDVTKSRTEVAAFLRTRSWQTQTFIYTQDTDWFLSDLLRLAKSVSDSRFWQRLPTAAVTAGPFWAVAPLESRIGVVTSESLTAQQIGSNPEITKWACSAIEERVVAVTDVTELIRRRPELRAWWPPMWHVDDAWGKDSTDPRTWTDLSVEARLLVLLRASKHRLGLLEQLLRHWKDEPPGAVRFILDLRAAASAGNARDQAFKEAHDSFLNYVSSRAFDSDQPVEFIGLLPSCQERLVTHCEGRPMLDESGTFTSAAFCPRGQCPCKPYRSNVPGWHKLYGARLRPRRDLDWSEWTLLEILDTLGLNDLPVRLLGFRRDEYVQKVGGWLNRLNEIRSRLRCSCCGAVMRANAAYAKNLARYNATVMACSGGQGHDLGVYLSHCWECRTIIDSREARVRVEGFYLCLKCGTGPQHSSNYTPGDLCPRCESANVTVAAKGSSCASCGHSFVPHRVRPA